MWIVDQKFCSASSGFDFTKKPIVTIISCLTEDSKTWLGTRFWFYVILLYLFMQITNVVGRRTKHFRTKHFPTNHL